MLKTRIITAIFLLVGLLALVFTASIKVWSFVCLVLAGLAIREWSDLIGMQPSRKLMYSVGFLFAGVAVIVMPYTTLAAYQNIIQMLLLGGASFYWIVVAPIWLIRNSAIHSKFIMGALGWMLLLATLLAMLGLRNISPWLLLGIILTVSVADSAAYFSGKRFGRRKLAPEISPGKTWEGVYGALVAVTLCGFALCYSQGFSYWLIVSLWMIVTLSIMGDLIESLLKRKAGLKDSGTLLPGHGGVFDRIDGLLPTLTVTLFCFYLALFNGFGFQA